MKDNEPHWLEQLDGVGILKVWGLRSSAALFDPCHKETKGDATTDDELQAVKYVEAVGGFVFAWPLLRWVFADGKPLETYPYRGPGESLMMAAMRHGQVPMMVKLSEIGKKPTHDRLRDLLFATFLQKLERKMKREPLKIVRHDDLEAARIRHEELARWKRANGIPA